MQLPNKHSSSYWQTECVLFLSNHILGIPFVDLARFYLFESLFQLVCSSRPINMLPFTLALVRPMSMLEAFLAADSATIKQAVKDESFIKKE